MRVPRSAEAPNAPNSLVRRQIDKTIAKVREGWVFFHCAPAGPGCFYYCCLSDGKDMAILQLSEDLGREIKSWHALFLLSENKVIRLPACLGETNCSARTPRLAGLSGEHRNDSRQPVLLALSASRLRAA